MADTCSSGSVSRFCFPAVDTVFNLLGVATRNAKHASSFFSHRRSRDRPVHNGVYRFHDRQDR